MIFSKKSVSQICEKYIHNTSNVFNKIAVVSTTTRIYMVNKYYVDGCDFYVPHMYMAKEKKINYSTDANVM